MVKLKEENNNLKAVSIISADHMRYKYSYNMAGGLFGIFCSLMEPGRSANFHDSACLFPLYNRRLVSSVGRACRAGGRGFEPQTGPTLRVLK